MSERSDHDEIQHSRDRLHKLEPTVQALIWRLDQTDKTMKEMIAEVRPLLADAIYAKRKRADAFARLALTAKWLTVLAAVAAVFEGAWKLAGN